MGENNNMNLNMKEEQSNKNVILIVIITILSVLILGLTYYTFFVRNKDKQNDKDKPREKTNNEILSNIFDDEYYYDLEEEQYLHLKEWNNYTNVPNEILEIYKKMDFLNHKFYNDSIHESNFEINKNSARLYNASGINNIDKIMSVLNASEVLYNYGKRSTCTNAYSKSSKKIYGRDDYDYFEFCDSISKEAFDKEALKMYNDTFNLDESFTGALGGRLYLVEYNSKTKEYNFYSDLASGDGADNHLYSKAVNSNKFNDTYELEVQIFTIYNDDSVHSTYHLYTNDKNNAGIELGNVSILTPPGGSPADDRILKSETVDKIFKQFSDKLNTYKYTFKKVDNNYVFEKIELVK